jgi:ribonuclease HII
MDDQLRKTLLNQGRQAKIASRELAVTPTTVKDQALMDMADALEAGSQEIIATNRRDLEQGEKAGLTAALMERLMLDEKRIKDMAQGLREIAALPDPVGQVLEINKRPNGLEVGRVRTPIGVIGIIYESRPNVTALRRELAEEIKKQAISWAVAAVYPPYLDTINIYQATIQAMNMAVKSLNPHPDYLLIDAVKLPDIHIRQQSIIKGDLLSVSIAAASILAKVERDNAMEAFDDLYPGYGFARHKGYATREHIELLMQKGPCPIHRVSFEPVKSLLKGGTYGEQPGLFE